MWFDETSRHCRQLGRTACRDSCRHRCLPLYIVVDSLRRPQVNQRIPASDPPPFSFRGRFLRGGGLLLGGSAQRAPHSKFGMTWSTGVTARVTPPEWPV